MAIKFKVTVALVLVYVCTVFSTCKKGGGLLGGCPNSLYSFQLNYTLNQNKTTYKVGDTISIQISHPVNFVDLVTNQTISFNNAVNLGTAISFFQEKNDSTPIHAANKFSYRLKSGIETKNADSTFLREYLFQENNGEYVFILSIIPLQKGLFRFGLSNSVNVSRKNEPCPKASFNIYLKEGISHNYFLNPNLANLDPNTLKDTLSPGSTFFFKVE